MPAYKINKTTGNPDTLIAGGTLYADAPLLTVVSSYDSVAAPGWARLTTDVAGRTLLRADYKELFDLVTKRGLIGAGKPFGEGNGSTTFVLPDAREATFKGIGLTSLSNSHYDADGVGLGEFVEDRTKAHAHNVYVRDTGHYHGTDSGNSLPSPNNLGITKNSNGVGWTSNPVAGTASNTQSISANIQVNSNSSFTGSANTTSTAGNGNDTTEVKSIGINYFMKVKQVAVPFDVAEYIRNQNVLSEYENVTLPVSSVPYDGVLIVSVSDGGYVSFSINARNFTIGSASGTSDTSEVTVKKGDNVGFLEAGGTYGIYARYYKLRDYSGR